VVIVTRSLKAIIAIISALMLLQEFGISISGLVAFGGIGGIAVGFASKDLLANFFGAGMIYFDRPFSTGDRINSPDRKIEGIVEHIGWRLTKVRTPDNTMIYIPNSIFSTIIVETAKNNE
jgi:MscS family membrane protein